MTLGQENALDLIASARDTAHMLSALTERAAVAARHREEATVLRGLKRLAMEIASTADSAFDETRAAMGLVATEKAP